MSESNEDWRCLSAEDIEKKMSDIETEQDFAIWMTDLANKIREGDCTDSKEDIFECLNGMITYLDETFSESPRDGLKWDEMAGMILEGVKQTRVYES